MQNRQSNAPPSCQSTHEKKEEQDHDTNTHARNCRRTITNSHQWQKCQIITGSTSSALVAPLTKDGLTFAPAKMFRGIIPMHSTNGPVVKLVRNTVQSYMRISKFENPMHSKPSLVTLQAAFMLALCPATLKKTRQEYGPLTTKVKGMMHLNEHIDGMLMPPDCIKTKDSAVAPQDCDAALGIDICKTSTQKMATPGRSMHANSSNVSWKSNLISMPLEPAVPIGLTPSMAAAVFMRIATVSDRRQRLRLQARWQARLNCRPHQVQESQI